MSASPSYMHHLLTRWLLSGLLILGAGTGLLGQSKVAAVNRYVDWTNEILHLLREARPHLEAANLQANALRAGESSLPLRFDKQEFLDGFQLRSFLQGGCTFQSVASSGQVRVDLQWLYQQTRSASSLPGDQQARAQQLRDDLWYETLALISLFDSLHGYTLHPEQQVAGHAPVYEWLAQIADLYTNIGRSAGKLSAVLEAGQPALPDALQPVQALAMSARNLLEEVKQGDPARITAARSNLLQYLRQAGQAKTYERESLVRLGLWFDGTEDEQVYDHVIEYAELIVQRLDQAHRNPPQDEYGYPNRYLFFNEQLLDAFNHHKYGLIAYVNQLFDLTDPTYAHMTEVAPWWMFIPPEDSAEPESATAEPPREEEYSLAEAPTNNLIFLIDVSGSMNRPEKLPLLKENLNFLVSLLRPEDRVAIVTFAGQANLILDGATGDERDRIAQAISSLRTAGDTKVNRGFREAYRLAEEYYVVGGNNRIVLVSDGVFEVDSRVQSMIERRTEVGIRLSVLFLGRVESSLVKERLSALAATGEGRYAHLREDNARKVLVEEASAASSAE